MKASFTLLALALATSSTYANPISTPCTTDLAPTMMATSTVMPEPTHVPTNVPYPPGTGGDGMDNNPGTGGDSANAGNSSYPPVDPATTTPCTKSDGTATATAIKGDLVAAPTSTNKAEYATSDANKVALGAGILGSAVFGVLQFL